MTSAESLQTLRDALDRHTKSADLPHLLAQWRYDAVLAPLATLPPVYNQMRRSLLQRLDMAVSFDEENCFFSPLSLLAETCLWTDKVEAELAGM